MEDLNPRHLMYNPHPYPLHHQGLTADTVSLNFYVYERPFIRRLYVRTHMKITSAIPAIGNRQVPKDKRQTIGQEISS